MSDYINVKKTKVTNLIQLKEKFCWKSQGLGIIPVFLGTYVPQILMLPPVTHKLH